MGLQKYRETVAASGKIKLGISGNYFRLGPTVYPVRVLFFVGGAVRGEMDNIDGGTWTKIDAGFDGLEILNSASGAQILDIFVGDGEVGIDRIIGEVSVISGEVSRVKAGQCFIGVNAVSVGAGNYPQVQLFNPVGSGKRLILNSVWTQCSALSYMWLRRNTAALAVLGSDGSNKYLGGVGPAGDFRYENAAAAVVAGTDIFSTYGASPYETKEVGFTEPLLIDPGFGVFIYATTTGTEVRGTFQWCEEVI